MAKKTIKKSWLFIPMLIAALATNCQNEEGDEKSTSTNTQTLSDTCTTKITGSANNGVELCKISGSIGHIKIKNLKTGNRNHSSASLALGFDAFPGSNPSSLTNDQMRVQWYAGGNPAPSPQAGVYFGGTSGDSSGGLSNTGFTSASQTVCMDIIQGKNPQFVYWVHGVNSADCDNAASLTLSNAVAIKMKWASGAAKKVAEKKNWYYHASSISNEPEITLSKKPALKGCNTEVTASADNANQALCALSSDKGKHYRVELVDGSGLGATTSRYFYLGLGFDAGLTTAPADASGDGRVVLVGGVNHMGANSTWLDFSGQSMAAAAISTAAYKAGAVTICMDISNHSPPKINLWVDGVSSADCYDKSTLTSANAAYQKSDWTSSVKYKDGTDYIRISGSAAPRLSIGNVQSLETTFSN